MEKSKQKYTKIRSKELKERRMKENEKIEKHEKRNKRTATEINSLIKVLNQAGEIIRVIGTPKKKKSK